MQAVYAGFIDRFFTSFEDILVHRFAFFFKYLLNVRRVDAAIRHEPCQGTAGDFTADRVKTRDSHSFGGVIYDNVHAGCLFEGPDVATVASNNAALHFLVGKRNQGSGHFSNPVGSDALNGISDQLAGFFHAGFGGFDLMLADDARHVSAGFLFNFFKQERAGFITGHRRNTLQLCILFSVESFDLIGALINGTLAFVESGLALLHLVETIIKFFAALHKAVIFLVELAALALDLILRL